MNGLSFEENIEIIDSEIKKRKHRWHLTAIAWMDFDDVAQKLRYHIYKKWDKWNPDRPLRPWLNQVINHQMTNMLRNYYSNFSRPCLKCKFNLGDNGCQLYGTQSGSCKDFSKWEKGKKIAHDLKFPISLNTPTHKDVNTTIEDLIVNKNIFISIEEKIPEFHEIMRKNLNNIEYKVYEYLFIQGLDEEGVAKKMGYKLSIKEGRPSYRQITKIKANIIKKARKLVYQVI